MRNNSTPLAGFACLCRSGRYQLPRVHIPKATRAAQQLQKAIKAKWGLNVFVLEVLGKPEDFGACAVAEVLTQECASLLKEVPIDQLISSGLLEEECRGLELLIRGRPRSSLSRVGWIEEAIAWMESATGRKFRSHRNVEQWNAGSGFALLSACSDDNCRYWLKATGEPNAHECAVTRFLWELGPAFFPKLIAVKEEWNAWLTEHAGDPLPDTPNRSELVSVARSMAQLQLLSVGETDELLTLGAFDQRLPALSSQIDAVIAYLIEGMGRQTSTKVAPLSRDRLLYLGEILHEACFYLGGHGTPDALVHNDLNQGNILSNGGNYVFTDWSEATVGNPFLCCERLCLLNRAHAEDVRNVYRDFWSPRLSSQIIDEAVALMPLLASYACLYGRGDWLDGEENVQPQFERFARSLARHLDRAAQDLSLLEILCR